MSVYNELEDHSEKRINTVIDWSIWLSGGLYLVVAILGYATFGSHVSSNVIASYPADSLFVCGGRLAIVALTLMSYPLTIHPCRASLGNIYAALVPHSPADAEEHEALVSAPDADLDRAHVPVRGADGPNDGDGDGDGADGDAPAAREEANTMEQVRVAVTYDLGVVPWAVVTILLVGATTAIALAVEDLSIVLGFVGSIGSTTISFILPGLLYWCMFRHADPLAETPEGRPLGAPTLLRWPGRDAETNVETGAAAGFAPAPISAPSATHHAGRLPPLTPQEQKDRQAVRRRTLLAAVGLTVWGVSVLVVTLAANVLKVLQK